MDIKSISSENINAMKVHQILAHSYLIYFGVFVFWGTFGLFLRNYVFYVSRADICRSSVGMDRFISSILGSKDFTENS